jgi:hypothetical protein
MAAHESPRTTKLYDRTGDQITLGLRLLELEPAAPQLRMDWRPLAPKSARVPLPKPEVGFAFR